MNRGCVSQFRAKRGRRRYHHRRLAVRQQERVAAEELEQVITAQGKGTPSDPHLSHMLAIIHILQSTAPATDFVQRLCFTLLGASDP